MSWNRWCLIVLTLVVMMMSCIIFLSQTDLGAAVEGNADSAVSVFCRVALTVCRYPDPPFFGSLQGSGIPLLIVSGLKPANFRAGPALQTRGSCLLSECQTRESVLPLLHWEALPSPGWFLWVAVHYSVDWSNGFAGWLQAYCCGQAEVKQAHQPTDG